MKINLPFKELNAEMNMSFNKQNIETIMKWYLESLHGKKVTDMKMRYNDANNYQLEVKMVEVVKPIDIHDGKAAAPEVKSTEVDITL